MRTVNWESVLDGIENDLLLEALESPPAVRSISFRKVLILAAVVGLLCIMGLTACGVNLFGIQDLLMDWSGNSYVTLAGLQNSAEYQALMEWEARCPKRQTSNGSEPEDPIHHQYGAFSYQAKKILDEILEKYSLQPYGQWTAVYDGDPESLYDALGIRNFLPESCSSFRGTVNPDLPGCSVRSGGTIFTFSDSTLLPSVGQVNYELNNAAKGYLPIFLGFSIDPATANQWHYRTKDGTKVLLCINDTGSIILADLPHSFLMISVAAEADTAEAVPFTKENLEAFADLFVYEKLSKHTYPATNSAHSSDHGTSSPHS